MLKANSQRRCPPPHSAAPAQATPRWICAFWLLALLTGAKQPGLAAPGVLLNELMPSNGSTLTDENGDTPDWIELHNSSSAAINLAGYGLSDNPDRPFRWRFRDAAIGPGVFLVVYASGKDRQPTLVAPLAPATLSGLRVWLRADAVDRNDPAQVRRVGGAYFVQRWDNQSDAGSAATQATASQQPLWIASAMNGRPALRFDGVNDQLRLPRPTATNSFCVLAVYRTSQSHEIDPEGNASAGGVSGQRYLFGAQHGGESNGGAGVSVGTNGVSVYEHGANYMPALLVHAAPVGLGFAVLALNYDARQPSLDLGGLWVRRGALSPRAQVTAPVQIGSGAYGAFGGDLAEVLIYDRPLSENERRGVAQDLAGRYALELARPLHTDFQLNAGGERLVLTRPDGVVADQVHFGPIPRDVSYGRQPDGAAGWFFFEQPTPGAPNTTVGATEFLTAPTFSLPGGFYASPVELTLAVSIPGAEIRYTLDGAEPDPAAALYRGPLPLRSRMGTPNTIANIPTVPGGALPAAEVFKGWVVRARAFKAGALPSATATRTYWVDDLGRARYSLPVVSLSTAQANLFDARIGIYVPGLAPNGNYSQRGPDWERPVHVELYETDNTLGFAQEGDVKIHGNTSQGFPIKGLDLDGTGGLGRRPFRYRLFPDRARAEFEHFLLRPTGHDQPTAFLRDELMQSLAAETGAETQAARPCIVFMNGEYWGVHYLKEKEDAEFVGYYGDVALDNLDYLEGYAAAKAGDVTHYDALIRYLADHDLSRPEVYAHAQGQLDVANYIDYKVCEVFSYRWDIGNHRLWRPRTPEGRWRWLQFDNDVGWGGFWAQQPAWQFDMLSAVLTPSGSLHGHNTDTTTFLLRRLIENGDFRRDFINRFADLLNTLFQPAHTIARIDQMAAVLEPEMAEHIRRWRSPSSVATWRANIEYLREYARRRPDAARGHLAQRFGLRATANLTLAVSAPQHGQLQLNTLTLASPAEAPWTGVYFQGHPITLTALARPGYQLAGWDGLFGLTTNRVTLLLQGDLALTARFEPRPEAAPQFQAISPQPGGGLRLRLRGFSGARYWIETATDLQQWQPVVALTADAAGDFGYWVGASEPVAASRFFRARLD